MKLKILIRRVHYWASICITLPLLIIISTGLILQLKKNLPWVQPSEHRGGPPAISLPSILDTVRSIPAANISDWADIPRIDLRPARGLIKVVSRNGTEVQLDAATGQVLQVAPRRSDLIESLHDGSFFHPLVKLYIFLPTGLVLLGLLMTGVYLFVLPILAKRRARQSHLAGTRGSAA